MQRDLEIRTDLRKRANVEVMLEAPRVTVAAEGPSVGPAGAPVTIVEFSDFQCPYCARAGSIVKQIRERYPTQVYFVYRHLPLESIHQNARGAAEASACADAQGASGTSTTSSSPIRRRSPAPTSSATRRSSGSTPPAFEQCVKERKFRAQVDRDLAAAAEAAKEAGKRGLGTPAFFVNGILLSGAKPPEEFYRLIDAELASAGAAPAASTQPAAGS